MKSPLVKIAFCMAALLVLGPACAGTADPVHDNLTQADNTTAAAENSGAMAVDPSAGAGMAGVLAAEDYDGTIAESTAALAAAPGDGALKEKLADAYIARAWYFKAKRLNTNAFSDLFKAAEVAPKYYRAQYELGRFHNNQWQFSIGIFYLDKALSLKPGFSPAYSERAYSYYKNQGYDQALADANRAVELDPLDPRAYRIRSLVYAATARPELATQDADRAVQIAPADAFSFYNRSLVYTAAGKPALAMADLETTLKLSQDDLLTARANADLQQLLR